MRTKRYSAYNYTCTNEASKISTERKDVSKRKSKTNGVLVSMGYIQGLRNCSFNLDGFVYLWNFSPL